MIKLPATALALILLSQSLSAAVPCQRFHGRAVFYSADAQLRIWHIGTHHEFAPDDFGPDGGASWDRVINFLKAGNEEAGAADRNALFADFELCSTEPFRKGSAQRAMVRRISHPRVINRDLDGEP